MTQDLEYLINEAKSLGTDISIDGGFAKVASDHTTFDYYFPFTGNCADEFIDEFRYFVKSPTGQAYFDELINLAYNDADDDKTVIHARFDDETEELIGALEEIRDEAQALISQGLIEQ